MRTAAFAVIAVVTLGLVALLGWYGKWVPLGLVAVIGVVCLASVHGERQPADDDTGEEP